MKKVMDSIMMTLGVPVAICVLGVYYLMDLFSLEETNYIFKCDTCNEQIHAHNHITCCPLCKYNSLTLLAVGKFKDE